MVIRNSNCLHDMAILPSTLSGFWPYHATVGFSHVLVTISCWIRTVSLGKKHGVTELLVLWPHIYVIKNAVLPVHLASTMTVEMCKSLWIWSLIDYFNYLLRSRLCFTSLKKETKWCKAWQMSKKSPVVRRTMKMKVGYMPFSLLKLMCPILQSVSPAESIKQHAFPAARENLISARSNQIMSTAIQTKWSTLYVLGFRYFHRLIWNDDSLIASSLMKSEWGSCLQVASLLLLILRW